MKRFLWNLMGVLAGLCVSGAAVQAQTELLNNPGMEGTYGGVAYNWGENTWGNPYPSVSWSRETSNVNSGTSAQKVVINSLGGGGTILVQDFSMAAGRTYEASVWLRSSNSVKVHFHLRRPDNWYQAGASRTLRPGTSWQKVTIRGGFSGGTSAQFVLQFKSTGTVWIDDASLKDVTSSVSNAALANTGTIPNRYFGLHLNKLGEHNIWPGIGQGSIRLWDTATTWTNIEPWQNGWNWGPNWDAPGFRLDYYVNHVRNNSSGSDIIYTMGITPDWAARRPGDDTPWGGSASPPNSMDDWRDYVRTVGNRYKGRIKYWEIWNEADIPQHYSGSVSEMVEMTRIAREELKAIDAGNVILSPNITIIGLTWLDEFLLAGGGQYVDIISFHMYPQAEVERELPLITGLRNLMQNHGVSSKPLWNTEGSVGANTGVPGDPASGASGAMPNGQARAGVARSYIVQWAYGVSNFSWYTWEHNWNGQVWFSTSADGWKNPLAGGVAYREVGNWLKGAQMTGKWVDSSGFWTVEIKRANGYVGRIVWHQQGHSFNWTIPAGWGTQRVRRLNGTSSSIYDGNQVWVSGEPVLLQNQ
jgi:hypothetical protein